MRNMLPCFSVCHNPFNFSKAVELRRTARTIGPPSSPQACMQPNPAWINLRVMQSSRVTSGRAVGSRRTCSLHRGQQHPLARKAVLLAAASGNGNGNGLPSPASFLRPYKPPQRMPAQTGEAFKASGKTVVVTGGSQGIGRATALLFAKKGFNVVVAARDLQKLQYVAQDCAQAAGRQGAGLAVQCDVTSQRDVQDLSTAAFSRFENVDLVVNSAGIISRGKFMDTPLAEAKRLMDVNFCGAYIVAQTFIPLMAKEAQRKKGGDRPSIIMVNSFAGKVPTKHMSAFSASKYALGGLVDAIRAEVEPLGIHLGQVHPGLVKSNFMERAEFWGDDSGGERKAFRQQVRNLPFAQAPQEIAEAIYDAYMTKQNDVTVGLPFMAAAGAFRLTGANVSALPFL